MDPVETVMELACVDRETAAAALSEYREIWVAVDALLTKPMSEGDRFLPPPPTVDDGLSPEQRALCLRGRWLQDQVNVVFSVAHSKVRTLPEQDQSAPEVSAPPVELPQLEQLQSPPLTTESARDSRVQTAQPAPQSASPQ